MTFIGIRFKLHHFILTISTTARLNTAVACYSNVQMDDFCRYGRVMNAHVRDTRIGFTVGSCSISIQLKIGVSSRIAKIDTAAVTELSGRRLAKIISAKGAGYKCRLYVNVAFPLVVILNAGVRSRRLVKVIAVTPQYTVCDDRGGILIGKDASIFRNIRIVNDNCAIRNDRR